MSKHWVQIQAKVSVQAHAELRNLYAEGSLELVHATMRSAISLLRHQQFAGAVAAAQQAFDLLQHFRSQPLLHAQAAALLGHCCMLHQHTAPAPGDTPALKHHC